MQHIQFEPSEFTILVVEDNASNMRLLIELLLDEGYEVEAAVNGLEALEKAEQMHPDLILLDLMMPGINGYEVCEKLQDNPHTQGISVIFITAMAQVGDKIKAFELGAVDYITKPFNTREVMVRLEKHLIRRSHYKYLEQKVKTLEQTLFACCPDGIEASSAPLSPCLEQLVHDIHQLKNTEEALRQREEPNEKRWQLALWGNNDGIWDWDVTQNQVFYSPQWKSMLGYADDDISNHPDEWKQRIHPDDLAPIMTTLKEHLDGAVSEYVGEHRLRCKDGSYKWILGRGKAIWDEQDRLVRMVGSNTDISDLKEREQRLQEAKEVAERANQEKIDFLTRISHELQTPLSVVLGLSQLLIEELRGHTRLRPKDLEHLQNIHRSGKKMLTILNDIREFLP